MGKENRDFLWVLIGLLLVGLTLLLCRESSQPTSSTTKTQSTVATPSPPVVQSVDTPSVPSPPSAVIKKKIDDLLSGRTITFQTNSAVILPEGMATLDQVVPILQQDPTAGFEISGHTDNLGVESNNRVLSENRAKAVMDYLVSKGVAVERLTFHGYGDARPIADNATAEGRARNRRIEFLVRVKGEQP
jgi:outer membrane protein OmpA-like peptidoglycan-associated protein